MLTDRGPCSSTAYGLIWLTRLILSIHLFQPSSSTLSLHQHNSTREQSQ